jgi:hypothetical protein
MPGHGGHQCGKNVLSRCEGARAMSVVEWLLDSHPAIRWQVMRDLSDAPADVRRHGRRVFVPAPRPTSHRFWGSRGSISTTFCGSASRSLPTWRCGSASCSATAPTSGSACRRPTMSGMRRARSTSAGFRRSSRRSGRGAVGALRQPRSACVHCRREFNMKLAQLRRCLGATPL